MREKATSHLASVWFRVTHTLVIGLMLSGFWMHTSKSPRDQHHGNGTLSRLRRSDCCSSDMSTPNVWRFPAQKCKVTQRKAWSLGLQNSFHFISVVLSSIKGMNSLETLKDPMRKKATSHSVSHYQKIRRFSVFRQHSPREAKDLFSAFRLWLDSRTARIRRSSRRKRTSGQKTWFRRHKIDFIPTHHHIMSPRQWSRQITTICMVVSMRTYPILSSDNLQDNVFFRP